MMLEEKIPVFSLPRVQNYHFRSFLKTKFGRSASSEHRFKPFHPSADTDPAE